MGLLDGLMGNASEVDTSDIQEELAPILSDTETVVSAYKLIRDLVVFTNYRFMFIDKQGVTGRKVEYRSVPYKSITQFKVETAGHFDLDAELKIFISGESAPLEIELNKDTAQGVQKSLAGAMFG